MQCLVWFSGMVGQVEGDSIRAFGCGDELIDDHVESKDDKKDHLPCRRHLGSVCVDWKQQGARMTLHNPRHLKSSRASQVLISTQREERAMPSPELETGKKSWQAVIDARKSNHL